MASNNLFKRIGEINVMQRPVGTEKRHVNRPDTYQKTKWDEDYARTRALRKRTGKKYESGWKNAFNS